MSLSAEYMSQPKMSNNVLEYWKQKFCQAWQDDETEIENIKRFSDIARMVNHYGNKRMMTESGSGSEDLGCRILRHLVDEYHINCNSLLIVAVEFMFRTKSIINFVLEQLNKNTKALDGELLMNFIIQYYHLLESLDHFKPHMEILDIDNSKITSLLQQACHHGRQTDVIYLIDNYSPSIDENMLNYAIISRNKEIIYLILDLGAKPTKENIDTIVYFPESIKYLVEYGIDINWIASQYLKSIDYILNNVAEPPEIDFLNGLRQFIYLGVDLNAIVLDLSRTKSS